jgi:hypothetical protein
MGAGFGGTNVDLCVRRAVIEVLDMRTTPTVTDAQKLVHACCLGTERGYNLRPV